MPNINKIHSTTMSLNDRFTAIASTKPITRNNRSRSILSPRSLPKDHVATLANRNFLQQLVRKDKMRAALKLKRRSMRTVGGGGGGYSRANLRANNGIALTRGTVKALRVAANGRPIKTNSLSRVATMKADLVSVRNRNRSFRRSNSTSSITNRLGGQYRTLAGGAAQRVAQRNLTRRGRPMTQSRFDASNGRRGRSRSRSRSRARTPVAGYNAPRGRSLSRNRTASVEQNNMGRGRSRSRSRGGALPIQARLGIRRGSRNVATTAVAANRRGGRQAPNRRPSLSRRGVAQGRVQKRRNSSVVRGQTPAAVGNGGGRVGRARGRAAMSAARGRSLSRNASRDRVYGGQRQQWTTRGNGRQASVGRRGRSQQRGGYVQRNGKPTANGGHQQQVQRRGRSRSRGRGGRGGGGRNQGQNSNTQTVNKDDLDKELDQYMLTTKTENNVDYLLKN